MGVIDKDLRAIVFADAFEPALGAFEMFETCEHGVRFTAGADRKAGRDQRVLDLEFADQRQPDPVLASLMFERQSLRKAFDRSVRQANALTCSISLAPDRDDAQAARIGGIDHLPRAIMIGGNDGRAAIHHEIAEQPQFGIKVVRDVRMIIHMVARQIRKSAGRDAHAVEAILVEPVR